MTAKTQTQTKAQTGSPTAAADPRAVAAAERAKRAAAAAVKAPKQDKPKGAGPAKLGAYDRRLDGSLSARGLTCLCGCGAQTVTTDARFVAGHDAKMRAAIVRGGAIPEIVLPMFLNGEVIAGLALVEGTDGSFSIDDRKVAKS